MELRLVGLLCLWSLIPSSNGVAQSSWPSRQIDDWNTRTPYHGKRGIPWSYYHDCDMGYRQYIEDDYTVNRRIRFQTPPTQWKEGSNLEIDVPPIPDVNYATSISNMTEKFRAKTLVFSIQGDGEARIFITSERSVESPGYLITIGDSETSIRRRCSTCDNYSEVLNYTEANLLRVHDWTTFYISLEENTVSFGKSPSSSAILSWSDDTELIPHKYMSFQAISDNKQRIVWKLHKRRFNYCKASRAGETEALNLGRTQQCLCFTFKVYVPPNSGLQLKIQIGNMYLCDIQIISLPFQGGRWLAYDYQHSIKYNAPVFVSAIVPERAANSDAIIAVDDFKQCIPRSDASYYSSLVSGNFRCEQQRPPATSRPTKKTDVPHIPFIPPTSGPTGPRIDVKVTFENDRPPNDKRRATHYQVLQKRSRDSDWVVVRPRRQIYGMVIRDYDYGQLLPPAYCTVVLLDNNVLPPPPRRKRRPREWYESGLIPLVLTAMLFVAVSSFACIIWRSHRKHKAKLPIRPPPALALVNIFRRENLYT